MAVLVAGCGAIDGADDGTSTGTLVSPSPTTATTTVTTPRAEAVVSNSSNSVISTISRGAEADEPARRNTIDVAWIAGSDSVWNDVDLPAAVEQRMPATPGWKVAFASAIQIAPIATDITARVNEAVAAGADALVGPMNISWLNWKEPACLDMDITRPYERYACILTSLSPQIDAANAATLAEMIDAVAASGLPSLMYAIPHSTNALDDPLIGPMITAAEQRLATFDPSNANVTYIAGSFTRNLPPFVEGVDFIDMVHPTVAGTERLADWLAVQVADIVSSAQR